MAQIHFLSIPSRHEGRPCCCPMEEDRGLALATATDALYTYTDTYCAYSETLKQSSTVTSIGMTDAIFAHFPRASAPATDSGWSTCECRTLYFSQKQLLDELNSFSRTIATITRKPPSGNMTPKWCRHAKLSETRFSLQRTIWLTQNCEWRIESPA